MPAGSTQQTGGGGPTRTWHHCGSVGPADVPARVADTLEDDAYAAATLDGALTQATSPAIAARPATGKVEGFLDRHKALLRLSDSTQAVVVVDEVAPGIEPERLLQPGMRLTGQVIIGGLVARFQPDHPATDPAEPIAASYRPGDLVLARITHVGRHWATGLLHPQVEVRVTTDDGDHDLRSLLEVDDVVTLELTAADPWQATLAHTDTPSAGTPPVLPGGPPWLTEEDLPQPTPAEEAEPETDPEPRTTSAPSEFTGPIPDTHATGSMLRPTPGTLASHSHLLGLEAQLDDLAARLQNSQAEVDRQRRAARTAREEAKKLRNRIRSQKDQMQAYRDQTEGADLFDDPTEQLRHDVYMAWLRRTPPGERQPVAAACLDGRPAVPGQRRRSGRDQPREGRRRPRGGHHRPGQGHARPGTAPTPRRQGRRSQGPSRRRTRVAMRPADQCRWRPPTALLDAARQEHRTRPDRCPRRRHRRLNVAHDPVYDRTAEGTRRVAAICQAGTQTSSGKGLSRGRGSQITATAEVGPPIHVRPHRHHMNRTELRTDGRWDPWLEVQAGMSRR